MYIRIYILGIGIYKKIIYEYTELFLSSVVFFFRNFHSTKLKNGGRTRGNMCGFNGTHGFVRNSCDLAGVSLCKVCGDEKVSLHHFRFRVTRLKDMAYLRGVCICVYSLLAAGV